MGAQEDWRNLAPVIRRIMQGERGVELTEGLDRVDAAIVRRILGLLLTPQPPLPTTNNASSGEGEPPLPSPSQGEGQGEGEGQEGISLQDVLNLVIASAKGDRQAGGRAYQIARALQQDRNAPPQFHALGKGLQNILEGLRGDEAVQGLPPEAAQIVRAVLEQLQ